MAKVFDRVTASTFTGNLTGTASNVTTNANLTGIVTSTGNATAIANNAIAYAKLVALAAAGFLGRSSAGDVTEVSTATAKTMLGLTGTNSGDATLSGENYLSLTGQAFTANAVNLAGSNVTGRLPYTNLVAMTAAGFLGRSAAGDVTEVSTASAKTMLGLTGTNSGDVTLAGENYLSIAGQVVTANAVALGGTNVTGTLPNAKTTATSANTLSAIVARNSNGDFSATNINAVGLALQGASSSSATITATNTGSSNVAITQIVRGDEAFGLSRLEFFTGATPNWKLGLFTGDSKLTVHDGVNVVNTLVVTPGTGTTSTAAFAGGVTANSFTGTWSGTAIAETKGGTNQTTYTQGDLLYASASNTLSKLAKNTSSTRFLSNTGSSNNPAWAQVDLTTGVTGVLPNANTTGASANTASTLVLRDSNGDFVARTPTVTSLIMGPSSASFVPTGAAPIYTSRAWVQFDGVSTTSDLTGSYSRTGTTVTVTATAHGHQVGHFVYLDVTSGAVADIGAEVVTVADANTFTITHTASGSTSGNVTLRRSLILGSGNVHTVVHGDTAGAAGRYGVNFSTFAAANTYGFAGMSGRTSGGGTVRLSDGATPATGYLRVSTLNNGGNSVVDADFVSVVIVF